MQTTPPTTPVPPTPRVRKRLALHWKIMIGLALGVALGILLNATWGIATWRSLGVDHPQAFLRAQEARVAVLPDGVERASALDPSDATLVDRPVHLLTQAQIDRLGLATVEANQDPSLLAETAWYVRRTAKFVGDLFLRALTFITVPIVLFSLVAGTSTLRDLAKLGRVGLKMISIYLFTTVCAITIGLVTADVVGPGRVISEQRAASLRAMAEEAGARAPQAPPSLWQFVLDIVPANPFAALANAQMLSVVFTGLVIGLALAVMPSDRARPVAAFFEGMSEVIVRVVGVLMRTAPVAVLCLVAPIIADLGFDILKSLAVYAACVVGGLVVMGWGVYPALLMALGRVSPRRFYRALAPAQLLAFSSSSSNATLSVTIDCLTRRLGASNEVASFVLPIGATVNMDGTALYQGVATVFIAQLFGLDLTLMQQVTIVLTALLASIGTAGVPGAGLVMLTIVLQSVNVPTQGIAVILTIDRILDMCRTVVNITGDAMVCAVIASQEKELLTEAEVERRSLAEGSSASVDTSGDQARASGAGASADARIDPPGA